MTREITVRFRGSRRQAVSAVRAFASQLASSVPNNIQAEFTGAIAKTVFAENRKQFMKKTTRGRDDFGNSWDDISQAWKDHKGHDKIGIYTGDMLESLSPGFGTGASYKPSPNQIAETRGGTLSLGSSVKHTKYFNAKRRVMFKRSEAAGATSLGAVRGAALAMKAWARSHRNVS